MRNRLLWSALLLVGLLAPLSGCSVSPALTSITVTPANVTASATNGLQEHFTAIGTYTRPGHTAVTQDITSSVTWSSAMPQMVTIDSAGVATVTGLVIGNTTISASAPGFHGDIVGSANFVVQTPPPPAIVVNSLSIAPSSLATLTLNRTIQFSADGMNADDVLVKMSAQPRWTSSNPQIIAIDAATGIGRATGVGTATVRAVYVSPDGFRVTSEVPFTVAP